MVLIKIIIFYVLFLFETNVINQKVLTINGLHLCRTFVVPYIKLRCFLISFTEACYPHRSTGYPDGLYQGPRVPGTSAPQIAPYNVPVPHPHGVVPGYPGTIAMSHQHPPGKWILEKYHKNKYGS